MLKNKGGNGMEWRKTDGGVNTKMQQKNNN